MNTHTYAILTELQEQIAQTIPQDKKPNVNILYDNFDGVSDSRLHITLHDPNSNPHQTTWILTLTITHQITIRYLTTTHHNQTPKHLIHRTTLELADPNSLPQTLNIINNQITHYLNHLHILTDKELAKAKDNLDQTDIPAAQTIRTLQELSRIAQEIITDNQDLQSIAQISRNPIITAQQTPTKQ